MSGFLESFLEQPHVSQRKVSALLLRQGHADALSQSAGNDVNVGFVDRLHIAHSGVDAMGTARGCLKARRTPSHLPALSPEQGEQGSGGSEPSRKADWETHLHPAPACCCVQCETEFLFL